MKALPHLCASSEEDPWVHWCHRCRSIAVNVRMAMRDLNAERDEPLDDIEAACIIAKQFVAMVRTPPLCGWDLHLCCGEDSWDRVAAVGGYCTHNAHVVGVEVVG